MRVLDEVLADGSYMTMSDTDLQRYAYAIRYYGNWPDTIIVLNSERPEPEREYVTCQAFWARLGLTPDEFYARLRAVRARLDAIQARATTPAAPVQPPRSWGYAPTGTTCADTEAGTGRCARCGAADSPWNPGAAQFLCSRHWDEY